MYTDTNHRAPTRPLGIASREVTSSLQPSDLREVPRLADASVLLSSCQDQGRLDGQRAGTSFDLASTHRRLPTEAGMAAIGDAQIEVPGERAAQIMALSEANDEVPQRRERRGRLPWQVLLMPILFVVAETLLGGRLGQTLTNLPDTMTWIFGVVVALALTVTAYLTSHALNRWNGRIMTQYGLRLAIAWAVATATFLGLYAFAVSGGTSSTVDPDAFGAPVIQPSATTPVVDETSGVDWVRCLILVSLLALMFLANVGVHVAHEARTEQAGMDDMMAVQDAAAARTSPEQRRTRRVEHLTLQVALLEGCLALLPAVEKRRQAIVKAYAAGARAEMSLDQNALWDGAALAAPAGPPSWVAVVEGHLTDVRNELAILKDSRVAS